MAQFGLRGAEQAIGQGLGAGVAAIEQGLGGATSALSAFADPGRQAANQQAMLSGAMGNEQQQQAFNDFNASPGQQFLRQQGEQGIINQSAALGGLGGGDVRRELSRFGTGLAQQDFGNHFNRLSQVAGQGLQAAGQQAGFNQQAGMGAANLFSGAGQNIANNRFQTGRDIASNVGRTTSALSNLANQQGSGISDIIGQGGTNMANLLSGAGQGSAAQQQQLAQMLMNAGLGQGSNLAGLQTQIGQAKAGGITGGAAGLRSGIGQLAGAASSFMGGGMPV